MADTTILGKARSQLSPMLEVADEEALGHNRVALGMPKMQAGRYRACD